MLNIKKLIEVDAAGTLKKIECITHSGKKFYLIGVHPETELDIDDYDQARKSADMIINECIRGSYVSRLRDDGTVFLAVEID